MTGEKETIEIHDKKEHWRCPMLGGPVPFKYCRTMGDGFPCRRILGCWGAAIDIERFVTDHYSEESLRAAWEKPSPTRMGRILGVLDQVGRRTEDGESVSKSETDKHPDSV